MKWVPRGAPEWPPKPHRNSTSAATQPRRVRSVRPAIAGYASFVGNRVGQKGNPQRLAPLYQGWCIDLPYRHQ
jgi:hypothetical protein